MKFLKNNLKVIIAFVLGLILAGGIVYASVSSREVSYTTNKNAEIQNVEEALNDLYNKQTTTKLGTHGDFTTTDSSTIHTIPVGFRASKIIIYIPSSTTDISVIYIYDSSINSSNLLWASSSEGGRNTANLSTMLSISIGDNNFTYKAEDYNTLGKTYWYAIK